MCNRRTDKNGSRGSSLMQVSRAASPSFGRPENISVAPRWPWAAARFGLIAKARSIYQGAFKLTTRLQCPAETRTGLRIGAVERDRPACQCLGRALCFDRIELLIYRGR